VPNSAIVSNERGEFVYAFEYGQKREIPVTMGLGTMVSSEISGGGLFEGLELMLDPEGLLASPDEPGFPPMWGGW